MGKLLLLLHAGVVIIYCRYLAPHAGGDMPIYAWSLALALAALRRHALLSRAFLLHIVFLVGSTAWLCHFFLDPALQLVTAQLRYVKGMLLTLFLVLEVVAMVHLTRRYRAARRAGAFADAAFAHALAPYPLLPEMAKLFLVEFVIWRALLLRLGLLAERDGAGMRRLATIETGYRRRLIVAAVLAAVGINLLCAWLLPPLWWLAPGLVTLYLALLLQSELLLFRRHAIYDDGLALRIPNGVYGFVVVDKADVVEVSSGADRGKTDLRIARLAPANAAIRLGAPVTVAGQEVTRIGLCVARAELASLLEALQGARVDGAAVHPTPAPAPAPPGARMEA